MGALALAPLLALRARASRAVLGRARLRAARDRRPERALGGLAAGAGPRRLARVRHSALRADGLAGIFLALTGLTGARSRSPTPSCPPVAG
jgi:hypothetical protein